MRRAHPEDIVKEEAREEDCAGLDAAETEVLDALNGEGEAQGIVGRPVLGHEVPDAEGQAADTCHHFRDCRLQLQWLLQVQPVVSNRSLVYSALQSPTINIAQN